MYATMIIPAVLFFFCLQALCDLRFEKLPRDPEMQPGVNYFGEI
jgi:hypothetical protein